MKNVKRLAIWMLTNACLAVLLWVGFEMDIEGYRNIAYFVLWMRIAIAPFALSESSIDGMRNDGPSPLPGFVRSLVESAIICFLVWHGAWATAVGYLLSAVFIGAARLAASKPAKATA